jgi:VPDSG-CTERM motif
MNKLKYLTAVLIAVAGLGLQQAQATLDTGQQFAASIPGGGDAEASFLIAGGFMDDCCQFLGKFEAEGGFENGAINISDFVTINQISGSTWEISWDLTGSGFTLCGVLIKDGEGGVQGESIFSFFDVIDNEELTGSGTVEFTGDFAGRDISHISFFGCAGPVPDGGTTVMLLGAALGALGMARRFLMG